MEEVNNIVAEDQLPNDINKVPTPLPEDDNASTAAYIEKLNTGSAKLGLPPGSKQKINSYLIGLRSKYADAARRVGRLRSDSPEYFEHVATMNSVNQAMQTLADQVDSFNENQVGYIKDFDNNALSKSDEIDGKASAISKLYRGDLDLNINEDGTLNFGLEGKYSPYSAMASHAVKDFDTADQLLKLANKMYETQEIMGTQRKNLVMNQVKSLIQQGGRTTILSLINDDLIPGFDTSKIPQELYKIENYPKLEQYFLNTVTQGLSSAAEAGYNDKVAMENMKHGRALDYQQQRLQQTYDFKKTHPTAARTRATKADKPAVSKADIAAKKAKVKFQIA
jgi:hypothetical protein